MYTLQQNGQSQRENSDGFHQNRLTGRQSTSVNVPATISEQFKESWLTVIIGSIMFATGMCLLFWNEVCNYAPLLFKYSNNPIITFCFFREEL